MSIKIIADSASDLPKEIYDYYNIDVIPLLVYMDTNEYRDGVDIHSSQVFEHMKEGGAPTTAQVPFIVFDNKFRQLAKEGGSYIYIAFSSELSGTYQTAKLVESVVKKDYPDFDLHIIDSKSASLGLGLIILNAAKMAKEGCSKDEILQTIKFNIKHIEHIFTVDNLDYLYRGGRISKTAAFMGSLLNIKPILQVDEGHLIPIEKIRGKKRLLKRLLDMLDERGEYLKEQMICINHADNLDSASYIKNILQEKYGVNDFIINDVGSVIGSHTGPGLLGIYFLNKLQR